MKRFCIMTVIIILCFILQSTVFQVISLADVVPNLLLIVTVASGYMRGRVEGMVTGLFCGLLVDFTSGGVIGLCALFYLIVGYINGLCNKIYYRDDFTIPIILVAVSDFIYSFLYYTFEYLLRGKTDLFFYFRRIMLPQMVYTVLVSVLLYKLLHSLNVFLERLEKKEV